MDKQLYQHRGNDGQQAIMQQLLSTESLTGAQESQCQMQSSSVWSGRLCAMNNNVGQLPPTESTAEGGVKVDASSCVDNYLTHQRDTVINRRGQLGRWPPPVERYDSRLRADLYPYWQDIWMKIPPISEREEDRHSRAITSSKVSSLETGVITPLNSSEIFSNCSTKSGDVAETSDCPAFPAAGERVRVELFRSENLCVINKQRNNWEMHSQRLREVPR